MQTHQVDSDKYANARFGGTDLVDVSATWDEESGRIALFFANRGLEEAADVDVALRGFDAGRITRAEVPAVPEGMDRFATNGLDARERVGLTALAGVEAAGDELKLPLPALSLAVVELEAATN